MATAPKASIIGEFSANAAADRKLALNKRFAASRNRRISQASMQKALTIRMPVIVSCSRLLISASLS